MKSSWDTYLQKQLKKPRVKRAFQQESGVLNIGLSLARERKKKGLTQEQVAKKIGTSIPQVSRTERRPEHSNVQTLLRYAAVMGLELDLRLVEKH